MDPRTMTGSMCRKFMLGLKGSITLVFSPDHDQSSKNSRQKASIRRENQKLERLWKELMDHFIPIMDLLDLKDDFPDDRVDVIFIQVN